MQRIIDRIRNSEFLTFSEVLKLKVAIVTFFLTALILLTIPLSSFNDFTIDINVFVPMSLGLLILLTILLVVVNLNRFAMHMSTISIIILTLYYSQGSNHFYGYIMFFVALTVIIFYQDIVSYLIYGGLIVAPMGVYYIFDKGASIIGTTSLDPEVSMLTYLVVLIGFYLVFLIQFLISDNIYEKMNNEWVRMNKILEKYQDFSYGHLEETLNSMTMVVEGIRSCEAAFKYAEKYDLDLPIINAIYNVLFLKMDTELAYKMLFERSSKKEL